MQLQTTSQMAKTLICCQTIVKAIVDLEETKGRNDCHQQPQQRFSIAAAILHAYLGLYLVTN
jgi:hypothetical protein